jgi:hypothetical protein
VKITWVVYDQTPENGPIRTQREAVVRVGANVRRVPLDTTTASCGVGTNERHVPVTPVRVGGLAARLSCCSGGADDIEATLFARGKLELRTVLKTDGYDPNGHAPLSSVWLATVDVPENARFSEAIVTFDHGKQVADPGGDP